VITRTEGGRSIYYDAIGAGPDLMLVHGALSDADSFAGLTEILSDQFRCITLDRPGYNRSGQLDCATTIEEQAEAVEAVRRACGADAPWMFGHSSGGNFALGHACLFPGTAKGLILMEPALYAMYPATSRPPAVAAMEQRVVPLCENGQLEDGLILFTELLGTPLSEEQVSALRDQGVPENFRPFLFDQPAVLGWRPSDLELERLAQPVLLVEGDQTTSLLRDICQLLLPHLRNGELRTLGGCDHLAPQLKPALVAGEIVKFVEDS
jgi:pimeloyl-ACP methyl ester carboxylesterase